MFLYKSGQFLPWANPFTEFRPLMIPYLTELGPMWKSLPSFCSDFMLLFILNRKRAENRTVFRMDANLRFPPLFLSGGNGGGAGLFLWVCWGGSPKWVCSGE